MLTVCSGSYNVVLILFIMVSAGEKEKVCKMASECMTEVVEVAIMHLQQ
jgi:hypothetical protein